MNKETKKQIIIIIALTLILIFLVIFAIKMLNNRSLGKNPFEQDGQKETHENDIDEGIKISGKEINLNEYDTNITISEAGEYVLKGELNNSIIVDSKEKITLYLNGVTIKSSVTSAIANKGNGEMVVHIVKGTINTLKDDGFSDFDGCIYSSGKLTIEGSGILKVNGNQEEGEGIATTDADITINGGEIYIESNDDGLNVGGDNGGIITINNGNIYIKAQGDGIDSNGSLIINGGTVYTIGSSKGGDSGIDTDKKFEVHGGNLIALGSDMIQNPNKTSKQKYISFSLREKISEGSTISLKKENNEIISFTANESFKTLILSNSNITAGLYDLYVNGEKTNFSYEVK